MERQLLVGISVQYLPDPIQSADFIDTLADWFIKFGLKLRRWAKQIRENKKIKDAKLALLPLLIVALRPFGLFLDVQLLVHLQGVKKYGDLVVIEGGKDPG